MKNRSSGERWISSGWPSPVAARSSNDLANDGVAASLPSSMISHCFTSGSEGAISSTIGANSRENSTTVASEFSKM